MGDDQCPTEGDSHLRGTREPDRQATVCKVGKFNIFNFVPLGLYPTNYTQGAKY